MENSIAVPQKLKNRITYDPAISFPVLKRIKIGVSKKCLIPKYYYFWLVCCLPNHYFLFWEAVTNTLPLNLSNAPPAPCSFLVLGGVLS